MTNNFTYFRKYIIFKPDYLSIPNINPRGHGKVEIKGTRGSISVNIENSEAEKDYTISFLKDRQGRIEEFDLGRIFTNERGRGRADLPINLRELQGKGFGLEDINAILIRRGPNILFGDYIQENTGVLNRFVKNILAGEEKPAKYDTIEETLDSQSLDQEGQKEESEGGGPGQVGLDPEEDRSEDRKVEDSVEKPVHKELVPEEGDTDIQEAGPTAQEQIGPGKEMAKEAQPAIESEAETETEKEIETEKEAQVEKEIRPKEEPAPSPDMADQEERIEAGGELARSAKPYASQEYLERLNHKNQMISYILNILKFFPRLEPFKINLQGYSWWKIDVNGLDSHHGFLPYFNYLMGTEVRESYLGSGTTCLNQIEKYKHYLFGLYEEDGDTKYYVYGIPGQFTKVEHPFSGETGFNIWFESLDQEGYWLLYINPMTGQVVYPLNPMLPAY